MAGDQHHLGFGDLGFLDHNAHGATPQIVKEKVLWDIGVRFMRSRDGAIPTPVCKPAVFSHPKKQRLTFLVLLIPVNLL
jgi:hypothetical protein